MSIVPERFWAKVEKGPGCWEWQGAMCTNGYGIYKYARGVLHPLAHRLAWELTNGKPGHLCVLHKCDNRRCVRPAHLFLGTNSDNTKDMHRKGRAAKGGSKRGRVLSVPEVRAIRIFTEQGFSQRRLAKAFGVTQGSISNIVNRKNWAHV